MKNQYKEKKFIDESIQAGYQVEPLLKKVPACPDFFTWRENEYHVERLVSQWCDLARRGLKSKNMRPAHLERAEKMGSWGVGRFYFEVMTTDSRQFVLYYDRTPKKADEGCGQWILFYELI